MSQTPPSPPASDTVALLRWFLLIGATFGVLAFSFIWISRSWTVTTPSEAAEAAPFAAPAAAYPAPDLRLASLDGRTLGPPDFAGQVVVIDLWATWCGPCKLQAQILDQLHEEVAGRGVQFLAIDVGEDEETVRRYVERNPYPYPVLLDPEEAYMVRYRVLGLPTVMVVDRQGQVSFLRTGLTDVPTLRREIARAGAEV